MAKRVFSEEELAWLEANYQQMSLRDCAKHLQISKDLVSRTAKRLGLDIGKKRPVEARKNVAPGVVRRDEGYCLDCTFYKIGGMCGKSGRLTGALHKKKCFIPIEL